MTYRVIALDLDGTLLTPQKTILPESLSALQRAREAGFKVVIVTGRHHVAIHPFYQALALDTPAICCNGTYLYDYLANKVLSADPLRPEQAMQLIDLLNVHDVHGLMYVDNAMLYQYPTGHVLRTEKWALSLPEAQRPVFRQVDSLREAACAVEAIWKFALTDENIPKLQGFAKTVEQQLGLACEWSWHAQVDVAQSGNSKGKRLAQWVESEGLSMDQVIAFGDNYNDLSMLEAAGLGVAMGNADEAIKARADLVIGTNLEAGIAETLYRHLL
ncbi:pyridoxal phosphatase [Cedecea colo]|uniref:Pyridoxal phosphatase n=1 Tax=Cedecea colo TaxID=2552946 RepID=A0ABX0VJW2_9ENTR|nr:pyridoxal phosphatase [Cedecea colo]NIY47328.1 pyridoxal phosphatase [Cedecea colo]